MSPEGTSFGHLQATYLLQPHNITRVDLRERRITLTSKSIVVGGPVEGKATGLRVIRGGRFPRKCKDEDSQCDPSTCTAHPVSPPSWSTLWHCAKYLSKLRPARVTGNFEPKCYKFRRLSYPFN